MRNELIVCAFDAVATDSKMKARVWESARRKQQKRNAVKKRIISVLAAASALFLVFFVAPLLKYEREDELFTVTAYAMTERQNGTLWLTNADNLDDHPQYWGGYMDCETNTVYVGLDLKYDGEVLKKVELETEEGFFVRQPGREAVGSSVNNESQPFLAGEGFEIVGKSIRIDKENVDDYLYFWANKYDDQNDNLLLPDKLLIKSKATYTTGKIVKRDIAVELYTQVITSIEEMNLVYVEPNLTHEFPDGWPEDDPANENLRVGTLIDLNRDGNEELLLHYPRDYQGSPYICCQVWTMDEGGPHLAIEQQLYLLAGSAGYGGFALAETEDGPRLCIWYSESHSGDAEYTWNKEEYLLYDCDDLSLIDVYSFDYAREYVTSDGVPKVYHGTDFNYEFLHNNEAITEEEFLAIRSSLPGQLEYIVGVPPDAYDEAMGFQPIGQSMQSLLDSLAE